MVYDILVIVNDADMGVSPAIEEFAFILTDVEFPENCNENISDAVMSIIKKFIHAWLIDDDWKACDVALPSISTLLIAPITVAVLEPPVAAISTL